MKQIPHSFFDGVTLVKRLNAASLSAIPEDQLEETVVFSMISIDRAMYDGSALSLTRFARPWRQVVAVWQLWGELVNGGMHQYFYNSEGVDADLARDGLLAMGCDELAGLFADATKVWEAERDMIQLFKQRNAWEDFKVSERAGELQSFTKAFYAQELQLKQALRHFIRLLAANSN
jgi:hypothetical protein